MSKELSKEELAAISIGAIYTDQGLYLDGVQLGSRGESTSIIWTEKQIMNLIENNSEFRIVLCGLYEQERNAQYELSLLANTKP